MECIIFVGIPSSGKSTYYYEHFKDTHLRLNLDTLGRRQKLLELLKVAIKNQVNICIDNTNITEEIRRKYIDEFKDTNYILKCYYWEPNVSVSLKQQETRNRKVPENAIKNFAKNFEIPNYSEGFNEIKKIN